MNIDYGQSSQLTFLDTDDLNDIVRDHLTQQSNFNGFQSQVDSQFGTQYKSQDDLVSEITYRTIIIIT